MQCPNSTEVYTLNGDTLKFKNTLIKQGQGPAEVVSGSEFYQLNDGRYAVVEGIGSKKTFISKTNDINELSDVGGWNVNIRNENDPKMFVEKIVPIDENNFFCLVIGSKPNKYAVFNNNTSQFTPISFPYPKESDHLTNFTKSLGYIGFISKRPKKNEFIYTCMYGLLTYIFDYNNKDITNVRYIYNKPPEYEQRGETEYPKHANKKNIITSPPYVTPNYVYMKNNKTTVEGAFRNDEKIEGYPYWYSRQILVFDWNGKPVKKYMLDRLISYFFIDENDNALYGITSDSPDSDEDYLVKYQLPH